MVRGLGAASIEAELLGSVGALRTRTAQRERWVPEVVFLDLDLDEPQEELLSLVQGGFPKASVVALGRGLGGDRAARLLSVGVPSLGKPVTAVALARVALQLSRSARPTAPAPESAPSSGSQRRMGDLEAVLESYIALRRLSKQQRLILSLYLGGKNDKEIAVTCCCSEATVYEHWRRMARKAGGSQKADVIADFHRFLSAD